ncbi:MAG: hypothetical protein AB4372_03095, partial [Xenococcus sp. (in: cyanobacteria)]
MNNILQEIKQVQNTIFDVQKEIKTLKRKVAAYKGWTKKYRKQKKELIQENEVLHNKISELANQIELGTQAKNHRDNAIKELNELIERIEAFKESCEKADKIRYADKYYLIKEAENILFDEEILS